MNKFLPLTFLFTLLLCHSTKAQDTLVLKKEKIACKVLKVYEKEIEYKRWDNLEGPVYVMSTDKIQYIRFQNGNIDHVENMKEGDIGRQVIKADLFAPVMHKVTLGYEWAMTRNINFEGYASLISSRIMDRRSNNNDRVLPTFQGMGLRLGTKFSFGHPKMMNAGYNNSSLGGWFMRIDLLYAKMAVKNVRYTMYSHNNPYYNYAGSLDLNQYGIAFNFGWQMLAGEKLTVQLNGGIGFLYNDVEFVPSHPINGQNYYPNYEYEGRSFFNPYTNAVSLDGMAYSATGNLTMGYILSTKKKSKKQKSAAR